MATQRVTRFVNVLKKWKDYQDEYTILADKKLKGGTTKIQSFKPKNPTFNDPDRPKYREQGTQQSHFVEADIVGLQVKDWPSELKRSLGETYDVPSSWNQGIDRSFDKVQEKYIDRFNDNGQVDKEFVKNYLDDLSRQINYDSKNERFQYGNMNPEDIKSQLQLIDYLKSNDEIIQNIANDESINVLDVQ